MDGRRFGEVADDYDDVRPGYVEGIVGAMRQYHRGPLQRVLEVGAGTGKGTAVLRQLGGALTCLEPDPRMAEVLRRRYRGIAVEVAAFEDAEVGEGAFDLVGCATAWHWLDPATRNRRAFDALRPGGTLAIFGHRYAYADPAAERAIDAAFRATDPRPAPSRPDGWYRDDVAASGLFAEVESVTLGRRERFGTERYLRLVQTFGPYRARPEHERRGTLDALRAAVDGLGGEVVLDLPTTLVLARRP